MIKLIYSFWEISAQMAPYLLFGFLMAGILSVMISGDYIKKHLGNDGFLQIIKATLFGVPLPICSCGVVPLAVSLKKSGASKGAVMAFITSTPQTGIDSIIATYGMIGLPIAILRIITATISGILVGIFTNLFCKSEKIEDIKQSSCCCSAETAKKEESCCSAETAKKENIIKNILHYSFIKLPSDFALSLVLGLILTAIMTYFIPENFFQDKFDNEFLSMLLMVGIGIPIYICSISSIPLAVGLIVTGISPGAAFVFLVAGPATNIASLTVFIKTLGKKPVFIYLITVVITAILTGIFINEMNIDIPIIKMKSHSNQIGIFNHISAVLLYLILSFSIYPKYKKLKVE